MNNQLNPATYRKFNNLLSSGAVTVTGPSQPRILKTTRLVVPGGGGGGGGAVGLATGGGSSGGGVAQQQAVSDAEAGGLGVGGLATRCYICDDRCEPQTSLTDMCTTHTATKFPNKLAQLVGEGFLVIVCGEDYVCSRCTNLVNYYDRLENDVERVKTNLISLLNKKYAINEDVGLEGSPPLKMQKMGTGAANRSLEESPTGDVLRPRKVLQGNPVGTPKIAAGTPQSSVQGTQTVQRKATKIYKCTSCDYKTSDMRLFNTHYETCKQQTFQCKTCRKIFPHFGAMKQHMVRDHNTAMDNTCAMCHINFVNENSLRKHMETNHATNVLVTSTTTIPAAAAPVAAAAAAAAAAASENLNVVGASLYTCNHCQFKSTDKGVFDEHMRKHAAGKPKPFKCRLCSQRFETREAATVHAKQHQTNFFKCGTCSMTFPKRELLVKHFEVHQNPTAAAVSPKQPVSQNLNTQKLLQETIDEALSDTVPASASAAAAVVATSEAENNIRFFSCSICSLTFIQEQYYTHHMETHRRDKKGASTGATALNSAATALLSDEPGEAAGKGGDEGGEQNAEADIESLFEKLHSDKNESGEAPKAGTKAGGMVITSQEGSGGITFNITIPQPDGDQSQKDSPNATASVPIDMPNLDQAEDESQSQGSVDAKVESGEASTAESKSNAAPVSMPSLDDDNEAAAAEAEVTEETKATSKAGLEKSKTKAGESTKPKEAAAEEPQPSDEGEKREATDTPTTESEAAAAAAEGAESGEGEVTAGTGTEGESGEAAAGEHVAMELDEAMQAQVDGGQIKFIVNENGHLLQLDNHILTDAEGNQIIVQDPEQIQQLLQSVGVLQSEGMEGETLQMMTDGSGQMVLVHGDNNEQQLIDASLLNSEGQLIIQQGQDGEEGAHVISEDGTRIPVSVSYTEDGQPIVQVQQQVLEAAQQAAASAAGSADDKEAAAASAGEEVQVSEASSATASTTAVATSTASSSGGASGGSFFALEEFTETKAD
ncbi:mucin-22 isoform X1 [Drosophila elegans]|uniref:mucin-22 isoform X1 n=1 Tax=Drosophila elegans TaxID=30023 RepID=UPI0007E73CE9|nr:mucin-22 isoform X1 [Drosophila elegans]